MARIRMNKKERASEKTANVTGRPGGPSSAPEHLSRRYNHNATHRTKIKLNCASSPAGRAPTEALAIRGISVQDKGSVGRCENTGTKDWFDDHSVLTTNFLRPLTYKFIPQPSAQSLCLYDKNTSVRMVAFKTRHVFHVSSTQEIKQVRRVKKDLRSVPF